MSFSNDQTVDKTPDHFDSRRCTKGNWSALNIAVMVVAFAVFWPIGLFILYWNVTGRDVKTLPEKIQRKWNELAAKKRRYRHKESTMSDNSVFEEFQQTQYDRISEIKEEIKERSRRFNEYRANAQRRAEEEEFKNFMADRPKQ